MDQGLTRKQISEVTGLLYKQVQILTEQCGIEPDNKEESRGQGKMRRYSINRVIDFFLAKELLENHGMSFKKIAFVFDYLHNLNPLVIYNSIELLNTEIYLYIFYRTDGDIWIQRRPRENLLTREDWQGVSSVIVVNFGYMITQARGR